MPNAKQPPKPEPHVETVKQLAGQAGLPWEQALQQLKAAGFAVTFRDSKLEGAEARRAREVLGLRAWGDKAPPAPLLSEDELVVRILKPMHNMKKYGPEHHTQFTNLWGKGIPVNQQGQARLLAEAMLKSGELGSKQSTGSLHVWMTTPGRARLDRALAATGRPALTPD